MFEKQLQYLIKTLWHLQCINTLLVVLKGNSMENSRFSGKIKKILTFFMYNITYFKNTKYFKIIQICRVFLLMYHRISIYFYVIDWRLGRELFQLAHEFHANL